MLGEISLRALERLAQSRDPFSLTVSFCNPHPPFIASPEFFDNYEHRTMILISPSLHDVMLNSAYVKHNWRNTTQVFKTSGPIADWIATFYAMVEGIDDWIGLSLDKLEVAGLQKNTLVIYTSDHDEMLGAHDMHAKGNLLNLFSCPFPGESNKEL